MNLMFFQNGLVNPRDPILTSASSVICKVCFGKDFDLDNQLLHNLLSINRNFDGAMANSQPVNFWPILKYFPVISKSYKVSPNKRFGVEHSCLNISIYWKNKIKAKLSFAYYKLDLV